MMYSVHGKLLEVKWGERLWLFQGQCAQLFMLFKAGDQSKTDVLLWTAVVILFLLEWRLMERNLE